MEIKELEKFGILPEFIRHFKAENIHRLYPPQAEAVKRGILSLDKNFVLSFPTASGKTLIASLLAVKTLTAKRGKVIYIVPLVALASEKHLYYKKLLSNFKVTVSAGDLDSPEPWLKGYDFIVATTEKLDSLIRHGAPWLKELALIIIDEVHLLNDYSRGPTLEIVITRLRKLAAQARIVSLSATIRNAEELSEWLDARLIVSEFRPVKLYEGVNFESAIRFEERKGYLLNEKLAPEEAILEHTLRLNKQVLFFVSSRRNAEALAERLSKTLQRFIASGEKELLGNLAKRVLLSLETPTHQCRRLAGCIREGSSFHHAGLVSSQKRLVEDGFRRGLIKVIAATPTLALGVNLPCFRVVVRDIKRYYPGLGSEYIPTLEYKQFIGRAGRPQYDKFGEAILIARTEEEKDRLIERYIKGEPEDVNSKLAQEAVLRMHILSLAASEFCNTTEELIKFFGSTFFAFQYRDMSLLREKIESVLSCLMNWQFIYDYSSSLKSTRLGRRITQLYLDPRTAHKFILALDSAEGAGNISALGLLQIISAAGEMFPPLRLREAEQRKLSEFLFREEEQFIDKPPSPWEDGFEEFLSSLKLALIFEAWISEEDEEFILNKFKVTPGELYAKRGVADWLLYSLTELSRILKLGALNTPLKKLRVRLHYGVREELLSLVSLKDIGRKRARRLFGMGFKNIAALRQAREEQLIRALGPKVAAGIKKQILLPQVH